MTKAIKTGGASSDYLLKLKEDGCPYWGRI